jgi:hypothetical protein
MKRIAVIALSAVPVLAAAVAGTTPAAAGQLTIAQAESARSGASMISDAEIKQKLQAAGYTNVQIGEYERGKIGATATKDGQAVELEIDAQSGAVSQHIEKEKDDDDD